MEQVRSVEEIAITLHEKAVKEEPFVTESLQQACKLCEGNAELAGLDHRFKTPDSLQRKITDDSADTGLPMDEQATCITDALRYTVCSDPGSLVENYYTVYDYLENAGYKELRVKNTLKDIGVPYRGVNTLYETPDGYIFELQFHTPESLQCKEVNHKLYEEARDKDCPPERARELQKKMVVNADQVTTPVCMSYIQERNTSAHYTQESVRLK